MVLSRHRHKTMNHPTPEHAGVLILAETVFNFYAFAYAGACLKTFDCV